MSRQVHSFSAPDLSALARSLGRELSAAESRPGHVQLLNMLVRAVGYRNYQHFLADRKAEEALTGPLPAAEPVDHRLVLRVAGHFGPDGRLGHWPGRLGHQRLCLYVLWSRLPAGESYDEMAISRFITANHDFGDAALIRRAMVDGGLVARTRDGRSYRRIEQRPPGDALALIRHISARGG